MKKSTTKAELIISDPIVLSSNIDEITASSSGVEEYSLQQIKLSTTGQIDNNQDFKVGDIYVTKWKGEIRTFEIAQLDNDKLTVMDKIFEISIEYNFKAFQEMVNDYSYEKLDILSPQITIDSDYIVYGEKLLTNSFRSVARQDIEGNFIFSNAKSAQQFMNELILKYNVPDNVINAYNFEKQLTHKGLESKDISDSDLRPVHNETSSEITVGNSLEDNNIPVNIAINDDNDFLL